MTRETKAERLAREASERAIQQAQEAAEYPARLMQVLERATQEFNYILTVENEKFVVSRERSQYIFNPTWDDAAWELDDLVREMNRLEAERAEARRREQVRQAALAKLSKEEREILNLPMY